ncbi:hypothetical protein [Paraclostridium bifermentans]|uniref:hypothetical protein n=1 Tax=Paraclostridium bifermentans TaxID=1490 RepID=UPI001C818432|nr:hypothetical protein [Paraclostridium bifermentans]MDO7206058.1 hypothetical protein [Paraclostridium bifermentans]GIM32070.1 hypothetical protein PAGU1678_13400 [Paraclostridium bifermentans subsp. muricolitidis]
MKKTFVLTVILTLLCATITFAQPSEHVMSSVKDLIRVQNDLDIIIKNIISCEYDKASMEKTLKFDSELLSSIFNKCHTNYNKGDSNLVRRETDTIFYIASVYRLSINGILLYLEDKNNYEAYFLDSVAQYKAGKLALDQFRQTLEKAYKTKI